MILIACPLLGPEEEVAIYRVLASGQLAQGENVVAFERRFAEVCQVREAIAVSSGTAALYLALLAHRMTELQGALDLIQLEKLEQFTRQRIAHATFLTEHLHGVVKTPITYLGYRHVHHQHAIRTSQHRDERMRYLSDRGIGTTIHYPVPVAR